MAPIHRWLLFYPLTVWLTVSTWVMSLHLHLEVGDGAVELSGLTQGEYQCALVRDVVVGLIHLGYKHVGTLHLVVCLVLRTYDVEGLGTQFLSHLTIHQQTCHPVVTLHGECVLLDGRNAIVECIEVAIALEA